MTSTISSVALGSTMRSNTRPVATSTSTAGTRPLPSARGTRRCDTMPRSAPANDVRTSRCCCGREQVEDAVDRLGAVDRVQRRDDEVPGLGRLDRRQRGLGVADLADEDHVGVLPDDVLQRRARTSRCRDRPRAAG